MSRTQITREDTSGRTKHLHDEGGVGGEGQLLGRLLQQLELSQLHRLQLLVAVPAPQLLLERHLEGLPQNAVSSPCRLPLLRLSRRAHLFGDGVWPRRVRPAAPLDPSCRGRVLWPPRPTRFGSRPVRLAVNRLRVASLLARQHLRPRRFGLPSEVPGRRTETSRAVFLVECGGFALDGEPLDGRRLRAAAAERSGRGFWFGVILRPHFRWQRFAIGGKSQQALASLQIGPLGGGFSATVGLWGDTNNL